MNYDDAAYELGIGANRLRSIVKKMGMRATLRRRGRSVAMSSEDIAEVDEWLRNNRPHAEERRRRLLVQARKRRSHPTPSAPASKKPLVAAARSRTAPREMTAAEVDDVGDGLPLVYLDSYDQHREAFKDLRRQREARLRLAIANAGL